MLNESCAHAIYCFRKSDEKGSICFGYVMARKEALQKLFGGWYCSSLHSIHNTGILGAICW